MKKTIIIAEAGVNHNGDLNIAKKLIDSAKKSGADIVKFQTYKTELLVSKSAPKAEYQKINTQNNNTQFEMLKKLELSFDDFIILNKYCAEKKIIFLSSAFDFESIDFLSKLDMVYWKIPSGEINNIPYLEKIARLNKKIFLSTGMSNLGEIELALKILTENGTDYQNITLMHCSTEYPAVFDEVNLYAIKTLKNAFSLNVGYSDHTTGIEIPIAAVALGATVIEKHFTLDKNMIGPDHKASLDPIEFKNMANAIRNVEIALGNGIKKPTPSEVKNIKIVRKSIVAAKNIKKGEVFTSENITVKRPGDGLNPTFWYYLIGKKANRDYKIDEKIDL